jgi:uncharacterized protein (DUF362 family)/Pyruvate/2-oxoacid:ferredoxin oxidoreductase delta subunit
MLTLVDCTIVDMESYDRLTELPKDIIKQISGSTVVLKPNLATIAPVSFTRPEVIVSLGKLFSEQGFEVIIAEGLPPQVPSYAKRVIEKTGYRALPFKFINLENEPGEVIHLNEILGVPIVEEIVVPRIIMDEDVSVVNVPKLKSHLMVMFTGAIKNVAMGMVKQYTKGKIHAAVGHDFKKLAKSLVEVALSLQERVPLTVVDAIESMAGNGPTHGEGVHTRKLLYGTDLVSMNTVLAEMMGMQDAPVPSVLREYNLTPELSQLEIQGNLETFEFLLPSTYREGVDARIDSMLDSENWLSIKFSSFFIGRSWYNLKINQMLCEHCGNCLKRCPSGAVLQESEKFNIDNENCVRCLCCKEMCPQDAIEILRPFSGRFMNLMYKLLIKLGLF